MERPSQLWIVDRRPERRTQLARLLRGAGETVLAAPGEPEFANRPAPQVLVLGLADDFEAELDFAHRNAAALQRAAWVLIAPAAEGPEALRLFDVASPTLIAEPVTPEALVGAVRAALRHHEVAPLSLRRSEQTLAARVARWFGASEEPALMRALDPRRRHLPLLLRGEAGTGRGLLARYIHAKTHGGEGVPLLHWVCEAGEDASALRERADAERDRTRADLRGAVVWIEGVDRLSPAGQRQLRDWIEIGGAGLPTVARWIASAGPEQEWGALGPALALEPSLARALRGLEIHLTPLRDEPSRVDHFADETLRAFARQMREAPRRLDDDARSLLRQHPWPGNLAELEAVLVRSLGESGDETLGVAQLRFDGEIREPTAAPHDSSEAAIDAPEAQATRPAASAQPLEPAQPDVIELPMLEADALSQDEVLAVTELLSPETSDARKASGAASASDFRDDGTVRARETDAGESPGSPPKPRDPHELSNGLEEEAGKRPGARPTRRFARALAHSIRNPLVPLKTYADLLPERWQDPGFREQLADQLGSATQRIEDVVAQLQLLAEETPTSPEPVDVSALLEALLDDQRDEIRRGGRLVLKELEPGATALATPAALRVSLGALLARALHDTPESGDLYVACRADPRGMAGAACVIVSLRFGGLAARRRAGAEASHQLSMPESSLELIVAESLLESLGGRVRAATSENGETRIRAWLPSPLGR